MSQTGGDRRTVIVVPEKAPAIPAPTAPSKPERSPEKVPAGT